MKNQIVAALIILLTLFIIIEAQASKHIYSYPIGLISETLQVRLLNIHIVKKDNNFILQGKVKRRSYNTHASPGHIEYIITDTNGIIVEKGVISSITGLNLRHHNKGRQFSYVLPNSPPEGGRIDLLWHTN